MTVSHFGLLRQHEEMIARSGIRREVADARGYRSADTKAQLGRLTFSPAQCLVPALVIPVWSVASGKVAFHQARPDLPRQNGDGKIVKYETPAGVRMCVDANPLVHDALRDPSRRLWITEGCRKGDALVSAGEVAIALLGVWNWRGTNAYGGKTALPDWESVALDGREVFIVFDSDVAVKDGPAKSMSRLRLFLSARGAKVRIVYIPGDSDHAF